MFKVVDWVRDIFKGKTFQWKPKEGEWCWSQVGEHNTTTIIKVVKQHIDEGWLTHDNCEPFIGTLPTWIKEK